MDFGDPLFYEATPTEADVPLAAMRALARQRPAFQPQTDFKLKPAIAHRPTQDVPPIMMAPAMDAPPAPAQQAAPEWKFLIDNFAKGQQDQQTVRDDDLTSHVQRILKELHEAPGFADWLAAAQPATPSSAGTGRPQGSMDDYLYKNRSFESGDNPYAKNKGSGASGLYQFLPSTWDSLAKEAPYLGLTPEGIFDAKQQDKAMRYYTEKSAAALRPILGRQPTGGELYALHLLGQAGGTHVVQNPNAPLTSTVSKTAMDGNPWLYQYKSGQDLINALNRRFA